MFLLTNEQRKCFGLLPVEDHWKRLEPKPSPYHRYTTVAYLDGTVLRKVILTGNNIYNECEICEHISDDHKFLMPKTEKGKPVLFSAATLAKRTPLGIGLSYGRNNSGYAYIDLYNHGSQKYYYSNTYELMRSDGIDDFQKWVEDWCADTTEEDIIDLAAFANQPRRHVKFREGDVFRYKINRRLYGYGRILLDYALMRKKKEPFWDILMGKPLVCSAYHIVTDRADVTVDELRTLPSMPSDFIMDNRLFYGDYEIIGNIPVGDKEDYPIMYGSSIRAGERAAVFQCGKIYRKIPNGTVSYEHYRNNAIGFNLSVSLSILRSCIQARSNEPYWSEDNWNVKHDLRNPKLRADLECICRQFDLDAADIIK